MVESIGGLRMYLRAAAFLSSLGMLFLLRPMPGPRHPARQVAIAFLVVLGLGILQPEAMLLAGFAHWWLNLAIWAPLFWVSRVVVTHRTLSNIFVLLWAFNLLSSVVGVLQVYFPERFAPSGEFVRNLLGPMADGLLIELSDGRQVFRPFGLSDSPGGAASAGSFAVLAGVLLLSKPRFYIRAIALLGIAIGTFCLYICEVRSLMIFTAIGVIVFVVIQFLQGRVTRVVAGLTLIPVIVACVFAWSTTIGGQRVAKRINTLSEASFGTVYYANRGRFLEHSLTEETLRYPVGAGLGRHGMMYSYFGDKRKLDARPLWAEIQLTAWLYDGGILLVCLGYFAILCTTFYSFKAALRRDRCQHFSDAAAIIAALNVSWLAITFNYSLFVGQGGMLFWLLNAALFAADHSSRMTSTMKKRKLPTERPDGTRHLRTASALPNLPVAEQSADPGSR